MRKDKIEVKDDGKIELLRKDREQYEILVVTHHVQGEGASASSFFRMKKAAIWQLSSREVSKVGLAKP
nr:hypothetical protein [uncultured Blautia sp.]